MAVRVLFLMAHAGAARNFESTIRGLAARGHRVHLALGTPDRRGRQAAMRLIGRLADEHHLITTGCYPDLGGEDAAQLGRHIRMSLDFLRFQDPVFQTAPALARRAEAWLPFPRVRRALARSPILRRAARAALGSAMRAVPVSDGALDYLREQGPDVLLVTPLVDPGSLQPEYVRAAKRLAIPSCLCVSSWDNLSGKGLVRECPDAVMVWNKRQRDEAVEQHGIAPDRVIVTGAACYDHWFSWRPSRERDAFARAAGLDPARPFVLYVGSAPFIAPDESRLIVAWLAELADHGLDDLQVLVRPHPLNPVVGTEPAQEALARDQRVRVFPALGADPTDHQSRQDYYDSLHHAAAVVGVHTSAFLEAAIVGRHVFVLLSPRHRHGQTGQPHFRHLLTAGGGLLHVAHDAREHAVQLRAALTDESSAACTRGRRFVDDFVRPYGHDEPATPRVISAVESLRVRSLSPQSAGVLGPALLPGRLPVVPGEAFRRKVGLGRGRGQGRGPALVPRLRGRSRRRRGI